MYINVLTTKTWFCRQSGIPPVSMKRDAQSTIGLNWRYNKNKLTQEAAACSTIDQTQKRSACEIRAWKYTSMIEPHPGSWEEHVLLVLHAPFSLIRLSHDGAQLPCRPWHFAQNSAEMTGPGQRARPNCALARCDRCPAQT